MQNPAPEIVSALIDQRLDIADIALPVEQLGGDVALTMRWRNYHLIGDIIRGEVQATGNCLLARMQATLENEPTLKQSAVLMPVKQSDSVILFDKSSSNDVWKSAGMFALAAAIALMAVFTLNPAEQGFDNATTVNTVAQIAIATPTRLASEQQSLATFESEFGQMMARHSEFTATSGLNGLVTYAKLVSNQNLEQ